MSNKIKEAIENPKGLPFVRIGRSKQFDIPGAIRDDLPEFFKAMGYEKGVEVGVYKAEFFEGFAKEGFEVYGVDPWDPYPGFDHPTPERKERYEVLYNHACRVIEPYPKAQYIRKYSMDAVNDFEDNSLDFVYIDGNHEFRHVAEDVVEWAKKVRPGGVVSGHDYIDTYRLPKRRWPKLHVKYVIDGYVQAHRMDFFVLGAMDTNKYDSRRDLHRSWLWVKE